MCALPIWRRRARRGRRGAAQQRPTRVLLPAIEDGGRLVFVVPIDVDAAPRQGPGGVDVDWRRLFVRTQGRGRRRGRAADPGARQRRRRRRRRKRRDGGRRRGRRRAQRRRRRWNAARDARRRRRHVRGRHAEQRFLSCGRRGGERGRTRHPGAWRRRNAGRRAGARLLGGEPVEDVQVRTGLVAHRSMLS